jgi:hypothetical protein
MKIIKYNHCFSTKKCAAVVCLLSIVLQLMPSISFAVNGEWQVPSNKAIFMDTIASAGADDSVYVCSIVSRAASDENSNMNEERGQVTLNILVTIQGASRPQITLPYSCWKNGPLSNAFRWPNLEQCKDRKLLIIVSKHGIDNTVMKISGLEEIATRIWALAP